MFGITSWKFLILLVAAMVLIGPERLPEYVAKMRTYIRQARDMANGAKGNLKDQLGPEFDDIDWRHYDPRQYDPRKIIRDALLDDDDEKTAPEPPHPEHDKAAAAHNYRHPDPNLDSPYDSDAT